MKKFSKLVLLVLAGALVFFSCDLLSVNDDDDTENNSNGNNGENKDDGGGGGGVAFTTPTITRTILSR
jgi:hypothetical protein